MRRPLAGLQVQAAKPRAAEAHKFPLLYNLQVQGPGYCVQQGVLRRVVADAQLGCSIALLRLTCLAACLSSEAQEAGYG